MHILYKNPHFYPLWGAYWYYKTPNNRTSTGTPNLALATACCTLIAIAPAKANGSEGFYPRVDPNEVFSQLG